MKRIGEGKSVSNSKEKMICASKSTKMVFENAWKNKTKKPKKLKNFKRRRSLNERGLWMSGIIIRLIKKGGDISK